MLTNICSVQEGEQEEDGQRRYDAVVAFAYHPLLCNRINVNGRSSASNSVTSTATLVDIFFLQLTRLWLLGDGGHIHLEVLKWRPTTKPGTSTDVKMKLRTEQN